MAGRLAVEQAAWMAGLFDGEGCVQLRSSKSGIDVYAVKYRKRS